MFIIFRINKTDDFFCRNSQRDTINLIIVNFTTIHFFFLDNPSSISYQRERYGDNFNRDYTATIVTNT